MSGVAGMQLPACAWSLATQGPCNAALLSHLNWNLMVGIITSVPSSASVAETSIVK